MDPLLPNPPADADDAPSEDSRSDSGDRRSDRSSTRRRRRRRLPPHGKNYEPHLPVHTRLLSAAPLVLDPVPNLRTRAVCVAGDVLVTAHRNGVRSYAEAQPAGAGLWRLRELRDEYYLREAYLTAAIQPVVRGDAVVHTPYSRYFCVAAGSDRTAHSVCVLSTTAHFNLHHELHGRNKVVAMHFTQLALEPLQEDRLVPFVLSIDETGEVVIYNVERDSAVRLWRPKHPLDALAATDDGSPTAAAARVREALILEELTASEKARGADSMRVFRRRGHGDDADDDSRVYRLDSGVATQAVLVGPCVEMCNRCLNLFSTAGRAAAPSPAPLTAAGGSAADVEPPAGSIFPLPQSAAAGRYVAMSIFVSARARDVADADEDAAAADAELGVTFLRVLCSDRHAFVWQEQHLVREVAPADVCDAGVALCSPLYQPGRPMSVLVGRPRLRLWALSGCTGQRLLTQRVYKDEEGSGTGARSTREFFVAWLPLGRRVLAQEERAGRSWRCVAALTDDDALLLLGSDPEDGVGNGAEQRAALQESVAQREREEHDLLEAWLDSVEGCGDGSPSAGASPLPPPAAATAATVQRGSGHSRGSSGAAVGRVTPRGKEYTVLVELYAPQSRSTGRSEGRSHRSTRDGARSSSSSASSAPSGGRERRRRRSHSSGAAGKSVEPRGGVRGVFADGSGSAVLLRLGDGETLLRVPLPFVSELRVVREGGGAKEKAPPPTAAVGRGSPSPEPPRAESQVPRGSAAEAASTAAGAWAITRTALPSAAAGWIGALRWGGGAAEAPSPNPTPPTTQQQQQQREEEQPPAATSATEGEPRYGLNLMRPLAVAVFGWGREEVEEAEGAPAPEGPVLTRAVGEERQPPAAPPADSVGRPSPCPESQGSSGQSAQSRSTGAAPQTRVAAVVMDLSRRRRSRRTATHASGASSRAASGSGSGSPAPAPTGVEGRLQRRYMADQVQRAMDREQAAAQAQESCRDPAAEAALAARAELGRLTLRDEPSARAAVEYSWQNAHDALYIDFSLGCDAIAEAEEKRRARARAAEEAERQLFRRSILRDLLLPPSGPAGGGAAMSAGFRQSYRELRASRARLQDRRGIFDFSGYFATGAVPQQLLDLQERDKCHFEVADLRAAQARALAALDPVDVVRLYQNEERPPQQTSGGWRPHPTFPFDDEEGRTVDMPAWNSTAGPDAPGQFRWDADAAGDSPSHASPAASPVRVRAVTRELRDWALGPWEYAARWPSAEELRRGTFEWSSDEGHGAVVRRRALTRQRLNVKISAERERLTEQHQQELEELRRTLDL